MNGTDEYIFFAAEILFLVSTLSMLAMTALCGLKYMRLIKHGVSEDGTIAERISGNEVMVDFYSGGKRITCTAPVLVSKRSHDIFRTADGQRSLEAGSAVTVVYDPRKPSHLYIDGGLQIRHELVKYGLTTAALVILSNALLLFYSLQEM